MPLATLRGIPEILVLIICGLDDLDDASGHALLSLDLILDAAAQPQNPAELLGGDLPAFGLRETS